MTSHLIFMIFLIKDFYPYKNIVKTAAPKLVNTEKICRAFLKIIYKLLEIIEEHYIINLIHYFMWLKGIKLKTLVNITCEFGNTLISMLYAQMSKIYVKQKYQLFL